jgi:hypothetical protein
VENCGLKKVETAGPMMAADITTAPVKPTASRRSRGGPAAPHVGSLIGAMTRWHGDFFPH